jgi:hypothetical protein
MNLLKYTAAVLMVLSSTAGANVLECEGTNKSAKSHITVIRPNDSILQVTYKETRVFTEDVFSISFNRDNSAIKEQINDEKYKLDILGQDKKDLHAESITSIKESAFELVVQGTSPIDGTYRDGYAHFICHFEN